MAMSRKHYEAVARVIRDERENWDVGGEVQVALNYLAQNLAGVFAADNPNFDRQRFLAAARKEAVK